MPTATESNGAARPAEAAAALRIVSPRIVKPVPILLDKPRSLVMDFAAMEAFEGVTGVSAWGRDAWDGNPRHVVALIWASLIHEDPGLTLDDVKRMPCMTLANMAYLTDRLGELWGETMPDADQATEAASGSEASDDPNPRRRAG